MAYETPADTPSTVSATAPGVPASDADGMHAQSSARPRPARGMRNMRVEMLRVAAIVGIAVFHTFQPWFTVVASTTPIDQLPEGLQPVAANPAAMWILGMTALLGACGNHIFYMISGFYLIPSAAGRSLRADSAEDVNGMGSANGENGACDAENRRTATGYWRGQCAATARRAAIIILSVLFYVIVCAVINMVVPVPRFGAIGWWGMGLEFVWLYLVFVAVSPFAGWAFARMDARLLRAFAAVALTVVFALNAYIAFVAPEGGRGLTDWRKLMSAVTYLASFLFAGILGMRVRAAARTRDEARRGATMSPRFWRRALVAVIIVTAILEAVFAGTLVRGLLMAMSFKSTSLASFLAAWFALMTAASGDGTTAARTAGATGPRGGTRGDGPAACPRIVRFAGTVASGILGFYIAQSLLNGLWHDECTAFMTSIAMHGGWHVAAAIAFGIVFSMLFVLVVTMVDRFTRQPLLRAMRLLR